MIRAALVLAAICVSLTACGGGGGGPGTPPVVATPPPPPPPPFVPPPSLTEAESAWCAGVLLSVTNYLDRNDPWNFEDEVLLLAAPGENTHTAIHLWYEDAGFMRAERDDCFSLLGLSPGKPGPRLDWSARGDLYVRPRWDNLVQPWWVEGGGA